MYKNTKEFLVDDISLSLDGVESFFRDNVITMAIGEIANFILHYQREFRLKNRANDLYGIMLKHLRKNPLQI